MLRPAKISVENSGNMQATFRGIAPKALKKSLQPRCTEMQDCCKIDHIFPRHPEDYA